MSTGRSFVPIAILSLVLAACGGSTTDTTSEPESDVTTTAPSVATTAEPDPVTTTTEAMTTTTEGVDPMLATVASVAGSYSGEWENTTFGSTGPIAITLSVEDNGSVTVEMDLGGFVFGESDPDAESVMFNVTDIQEGAEVESAVFGKMTLTIAGAGFKIDAPDVPSGSIASMQVVANLVEDGFEGTYAIQFEGGGDAEGIFNAAFVG